VLYKQQLFGIQTQADMPIGSEVVYIRDSLCCFMSNLWFNIVYTICYIGTMVIVIYFLLSNDYSPSPFGLYQTMCDYGVPVVKQSVWADSKSQLAVVFVLSYLFAAVHQLHYFMFRLVVDFLAKHALVAKSEEQDMWRKIMKRIKTSEEYQSVALDDSRENLKLRNTIYKMQNDKVSVMEGLFEDTRTAKNDLCALGARIEQYLEQKSPQHLAEWKAANSKRV